MAAQIVEPPHLAADLKTLCLTTVATQWRPLAEQAARQRQAPADYLAQLVHLEVTGRRERRIQRRIQDARFPILKTLDAFSFKAQPDLDRDAVLQVFDCSFVAEAANVVYVGGVGTGKTHLSIALGMACCQHDYRVRFVTAAELVTLLVEAQQQSRLARKLAQLARYDVIIVDELGYVPLDKAGADLLFGFISQRYERRSLVVTTNLPFARWSEVFLDPTAATGVHFLVAISTYHYVRRRTGGSGCAATRCRICTIRGWLMPSMAATARVLSPASRASRMRWLRFSVRSRRASPERTPFWACWWLDFRRPRSA